MDLTTLHRMRQAVQAYMLDTVIIGTVATAADRYGTATVTRTPVLTSRAQLSAPTATEQRILEPLRAQGIAGTETLRCALPHGTPLTPDHDIQTADGRWWRVLQPQTPTALDVQVLCFLTIQEPRDASTV